MKLHLEAIALASLFSITTQAKSYDCRSVFESDDREYWTLSFSNESDLVDFTAWKEDSNQGSHTFYLSDREVSQGQVVKKSVARGIVLTYPEERSYEFRVNFVQSELNIDLDFDCK